MIQDKSMLVDLTISRWSATKHDKQISSAVELTHQARDAGRYNKRLIDKAHLAEIESIASSIRKYHYSRTLPWTDKGQRLLPSMLFMDYRKDLFDLKAQFNKAVGTFIAAYPQLIQGARTRLNTMFVADDYPDATELRLAFDVSVEFMPVPDADDFRVSVAKETQDEIRQQITESVNLRQQKAVKDCYSKVRELVQRFSDQCHQESGRIHDSMVDNTRDLVGVLHGLNITDDPNITLIEKEIRDKLIVPPTMLRTSPASRKRVALAADAILALIPKE